MPSYLWADADRQFPGLSGQPVQPSRMSEFQAKQETQTQNQGGWYLGEQCPRSAFGLHRYTHIRTAATKDLALMNGS